MVRALHEAGIEVILDVVFNHTAEGDERGPTCSFRGLDNPIYYMLDRRQASTANFTGCGNTFNCNHPVVAQSDHHLPALLGHARCTSTASASTWPPSSAAARTVSRWPTRR